jgi:hypothetical protein
MNLPQSPKLKFSCILKMLICRILRKCLHSPNLSIVQKPWRSKILSDLLQEVNVIIRLEENFLAIIAAIVDVEIQFRHEWD